jgi:hypothetical protein
VRLLVFSSVLRPNAEAIPKKKVKKRNVAKRMVVKLLVVCRVNEQALYPLRRCANGSDAYAKPRHSMACPEWLKQQCKASVSACSIRLGGDENHTRSVLNNVNKDRRTIMWPSAIRSASGQI